MKNRFLNPAILVTFGIFSVGMPQAQAKDVGFKDSPYWISTPISADGSTIEFKVCFGGNTSCASITEDDTGRACSYSISNLESLIPTLGHKNFKSEAEVLLSGSGMSALNSCDYFNNLVEWLRLTQGTCVVKAHFPHCKS